MDDAQTEPLVPLKRALAIGELLEAASKAIPEMDQDGLVVGVKIVDSELAIYGQVTVKDFSGLLVASFGVDGERTLSGVIRWNF
jgi:hypothetical protein